MSIFRQWRPSIVVYDRKIIQIYTKVLSQGIRLINSARPTPVHHEDQWDEIEHRHGYTEDEQDLRSHRDGSQDDDGHLMDVGKKKVEVEKKKGHREEILAAQKPKFNESGNFEENITE